MRYIGVALAMAFLAPSDLSAATVNSRLLTNGFLTGCAVDAPSNLKCWGEGFLGDGTAKSSTRAVKVIGLTGPIVEVTAGLYHQCARLQNGQAYCWGLGIDGQLGDGKTGLTSYSLVPKLVSKLPEPIVSISAGYDHTCATTVSGLVYCWGENDEGQLGTGNTKASAVPVLVKKLPAKIKQVTGGSYHNCALATSGEVYCWGNGLSGQLGDGKGSNSNLPVAVKQLNYPIKWVEAGREHVCAITKTNGLRCWGHGYNGELGNRGSNSYLLPVSPVGLGSGVLSVSAGHHHTCVVLKTNTVKCFGLNYYGQLGTGDRRNRSIPTEVRGLTGVTAISTSWDHMTCAKLLDETAYCWGNNENGELGVGDKQIRLRPTKVLNFP